MRPPPKASQILRNRHQNSNSNNRPCLNRRCPSRHPNLHRFLCLLWASLLMTVVLKYTIHPIYSMVLWPCSLHNKLVGMIYWTIRATTPKAVSLPTWTSTVQWQWGSSNSSRLRVFSSNSSNKFQCRIHYLLEWTRYQTKVQESSMIPSWKDSTKMTHLLDSLLITMVGQLRDSHLTSSLLNLYPNNNFSHSLIHQIHIPTPPSQRISIPLKVLTSILPSTSSRILIRTSSSNSHSQNLRIKLNPSAQPSAL
jgi:hypothetical protein